MKRSGLLPHNPVLYYLNLSALRNFGYEEMGMLSEEVGRMRENQDFSRR